MSQNIKIGLLMSKRHFSLASLSFARKPPKEEFNNNMFRTRKKTSEPFDRLRIIYHQNNLFILYILFIILLEFLDAGVGMQKVLNHIMSEVCFKFFIITFVFTIFFYFFFSSNRWKLLMDTKSNDA
jgi:hypothetical protein